MSITSASTSVPFSSSVPTPSMNWVGGGSLNTKIHSSFLKTIVENALKKVTENKAKEAKRKVLLSIIRNTNKPYEIAIMILQPVISNNNNLHNNTHSNGSSTGGSSSSTGSSSSSVGSSTGSSSISSISSSSSSSIGGNINNNSNINSGSSNNSTGSGGISHMNVVNYSGGSVNVFGVNNSGKGGNMTNYNSVTNPFSKLKYRVIAVYPVQADFGIKIIAETQFDLFFRSFAKFYNFEASNQWDLWNIISVIARSCKAYNLAVQQEQEQKQQHQVSEQSTNIKTHTWIQFYIDTLLNNVIGIQDTKPQESATSSSKIVVKTQSDFFSNSVKDDWIQLQLKSKESEFTELTPIRVVIGTWNVNSKLPQSLDYSFANLFHIDEFGEADIYAIGFQEIDMTAGALLREETEVGSTWTNILTRFFKTTKNRYFLIMSRQLVGIYICVFVQEKHMNDIRDVRSSSEGVGIMGMMGNKGGVGVRLQLHETSLCFINAHLAAHMEAVSKRNQNFHDIIKRTTFNGGSAYNPEKHDYFFWFGDLNYRLDMEEDDCKQLINNKKYNELLQYDQLLREKNANRVFNGYEEGLITFPPTYKFDPGTDVYDTSEKKRVPAYTDRILWKKLKSNQITQKFYSMHPEYMLSDHKPVSSGFIVNVSDNLQILILSVRLFTEYTIKVKKIVAEKYKQCYRDLIKTLDKLENDMLPEIKLNQRDFIFNKVRYDNPHIEVLVLENIGQVVCEYNFVPKPGENVASKKWLHIEPVAGIIIPGEKAEIKMTIKIDQQSAANLNTGKEKVDDILILHLKHGRDHFISIQGNYFATCFGNDLTTLCYLPEPIRYASEKTLEQINELKSENGMIETIASNPELSTKSPILPPMILKIPKEFYRLIDFIYVHGMDERGLFKEAGDISEIEVLREKLDTGETFDDFNGSVHSVAETLISFLENLVEPLIPQRFYRACIKAADDLSVCQHIVSKLPLAHFNTFNHLMGFLREVLRHSKQNGLTINELAIIFSRAILQPPELPLSEHGSGMLYQKSDRTDHRSKIQFMKHFLTDHPWKKSSIFREH